MFEVNTMTKSADTIDNMFSNSNVVGNSHTLRFPLYKFTFFFKIRERNEITKN